MSIAAEGLGGEVTPDGWLLRLSISDGAETVLRIGGAVNSVLERLASGVAASTASVALLRDHRGALGFADVALPLVFGWEGAGGSGALSSSISSSVALLRDHFLAVALRVVAASGELISILSFLLTLLHLWGTRSHFNFLCEQNAHA